MSLGPLTAKFIKWKELESCCTTDHRDKDEVLIENYSSIRLLSFLLTDENMKE